MAEESSQANRSESFGSAANLMIEALEKASAELERTVTVCLDQLQAFSEGIDSSLALQLDKVIQQSEHLVDSHGNDLEAKRDETLDTISALETAEVDRLMQGAAAIRRRFADKVIEATDILTEIMEEQLQDLAGIIDSPNANLYEISHERIARVTELSSSGKERVETVSQSYENGMSDRAKTIDDSAQSVIESSKAEVDGHLAMYSSQFDEKIDGVQKQLGEIVEAASKDIRTLTVRGIKTIDETRQTNSQVLDEHISHWQTQLLAMKDRFKQGSFESQSRFIKDYSNEVEKKLVAAQDDINRIAFSAKSRMAVNQKLVHNSLRRVEGKLSDEIDRLFIKFEAALAQESKINLMVSGNRLSANPEVIEKLNSRLRAHGAEVIKTFRRQVEQTEAEFARSSAGSNERIESIRLSSVESLEKQVRIMRSDLERITRNFHNELSELNLKTPIIEESGRAAALAVMAYKSAMLSLEND
ncbi:MAG: hypothetical protein Q8T09_20635 [Candidatus Melainabacteria bacterium]|nr:hypothetical protein [Candidatus Melainabacteria bacterium]